jgi:hypothetical protein
MMKKVALYGGLLALLSVGSAFAAGQFPGYPLATAPLTGFEYVPADTGAVATGASFTGSISGTTLTISSLTSGTVYAGQNIVGANVAPGTAIVSGSGLTWTVSNSQTVASTAMTSGGGGVNPQTEMIQTQQLRTYVLSGANVANVVQTTAFTIATLPTCDATTLGARATISNGTAYATGTYGSAVSATGILTRAVMCANTAGATTYAWAYN